MKLLAFVFFIIFVQQAYAEGEDKIPGVYQLPDYKCEMAELDGQQAARVFTELQALARAYAIQTCKNIKQNPTKTMRDASALLKDTQQLTGHDGLSTTLSKAIYETFKKNFDFSAFKGMERYAYDLAYHQPRSVTNLADFKEMFVTNVGDCMFGIDSADCIVKLEYRSSNNTLDYPVFNEKHKKVCKDLGFNNCLEAFEDIARAIKPYNFYIAQWQTGKVLDTLTKLNNEWDQFNKNSRYQTSLDKMVTTVRYSDEYNGEQWAAPPEVQYFFLHTSVVIDNFTHAPEGEEVEMGLAVEWVGYNNWNGSLPFGVSITSVYADREQGKQTGTGLMFHIDNNYSIGFVDRGNDDYSVFINLELFNLFIEKQDKYETYKDKMKAFR
jgi:hypothetical protein